MDGMLVREHHLSTGGHGETLVTSTIRLPSARNTIAEIALSTLDSFGNDIAAHAVFTRCTTNGTNPPLPPNETFAQGSLSGAPRTVVIRNGLTSITYEMDVVNARAFIVVNLFFWPFTLASTP